MRAIGARFQCSRTSCVCVCVSRCVCMCVCRTCVWLVAVYMHLSLCVYVCVSHLCLVGCCVRAPGCVVHQALRHCQEEGLCLGARRPVLAVTHTHTRTRTLTHTHSLEKAYVTYTHAHTQEDMHSQAGPTVTEAHTQARTSKHCTSVGLSLPAQHGRSCRLPLHCVRSA